MADRAPPIDPASATRLLRALDADDAPPAPDAPPIPGYRLDRIIGSGSTGIVWRAFNEGSDRPLALKLFRFPLADAAGRFWREIDLLASLALPCIPRVQGYGLFEGRPFIATDLIDGTPLPTGALPPASPDLPARVELLARTAEAVQALHERGIIHRDLKPANILITRAGDPIILDLGLATQQHPGLTLTAEGTPLGTPAFMAPEQARGEHHRISTRADVYSLGACAFEALTGSPPHDAASSFHELVRRVGQDPSRHPRDLNPALPRPLAAILAKSCDHDPARRYASAGELAADFRRWLRGEPVHAQPPGPWLRATRWAARHPIALSAAAGLAIIATSIAISLISNWYYFRAPSHAAISTDQQEARLYSRSGQVLRTWRAEESRGAKVALVGTAPGIGQALLLSGAGGDFGHATALACYGTRDLDRPLWAIGNGTPDIETPPELSEPPDVFVTDLVRIADALPDRPGDEVIAVHHHHTLARESIRIYDFATGAVLYEAWLHGTTEDLEVIDGPQPLVIVSGLSNAHRAATPPGENPTYSYAPVIFALQPRASARMGWINLTPTAPDREVEVPRWFRFLSPQRRIDHPDLGPFVLSLTEIQTKHAWPDGIIATVHARAGHVDTLTFFDCTLALDMEGHVRARTPSDAFEATFAGVFDWSRLNTVDEPPFPSAAPSGLSGVPRP